MTRVRVAVIDDDTLIREGLKVLAKKLDVVAVFASVEEFLENPPPVDIVILDLNLLGAGRGNGLQGGRAVLQIATAHRVLIYTNERRRNVLVGCLAAGAQGIVHKAEPIGIIEAATGSVADGEIVITDAVAGLIEVAAGSPKLPPLTAREREVLRGRARGESFPAIGRRLSITPKTAQEHMAHVTSKFSVYLRCHSAADLERDLGLAPGDLLDWS